MQAIMSLNHRRWTPRVPRRGLAIVLVGAAATASVGASATAALASISANWAGYAVAGARRSVSSAPRVKFRSVAGSWVQPSATCTSGSSSYAAFWVGLGGFRSRAGLEQVGTEADCNASGGTVFSGWYELIPAPPVRLTLTIRPGDAVSASITVRRRHVTVALSDATTGASFTKTVRLASPDVSSAEWIVEAPSACDRFGNCSALPLANFGTVNFTGALATANGHTGAISDPLWAATPIELHYQQSRFGRPQFSIPVTAANAIPAALTAAGAAFSVSWQQQTAPPTSSQPPTVLPGAGPR
jgi:hypothetical protein